MALWLAHRRVGHKKVVLAQPPRRRTADVVLLREQIEAGEYRPSPITHTRSTTRSRHNAV